MAANADHAEKDHLWMGTIYASAWNDRVDLMLAKSCFRKVRSSK